MQKGKKEILILSLLAVVLLIMAYNVLLKRPSDVNTTGQEDEEGMSGPADVVVAPAAEKTKPQPLVAPPESAGPQAEASVNAIEYVGMKFREPFDLPQGIIIKPEEEKKLEEKIEEVPGIKLTGIVWGDFPTAFINEKAYAIGDVVADAQILQIDENGVHFLYKGEEVLMRIKKEE